MGQPSGSFERPLPTRDRAIPWPSYRRPPVHSWARTGVLVGHRREHRTVTQGRVTQRERQSRGEGPREQRGLHSAKPQAPERG